METVHDSDWLYAAITVPWLSQNPVNLALSTGRGFNNIFGTERVIAPDARDALD